LGRIDFRAQLIRGGDVTRTALQRSHDIYRRLAKFAGDPVPAMRAWEGTTWGPDNAAATIVLEHPGALRSLLVPPSDLTAGEAYVFGDINIEGSILETLDFGARIQPLGNRKLRALRLLSTIRKLPAESRRRGQRPEMRGRLHTRNRDRQAVTYHYDTGNDFFETFLDPAMVYSCAYFLDAAESLEGAQQRKLDLICRKLDLRPGMRFLDVGCGWGALVIHAAKHYGVEATGITLSAQQAELASTRAEQAGVGDRVTIERGDYRELKGTFDAIASVGMFEHVGKGQLHTYFERLRSMLGPDGVVLNHGITNRDRSGARHRPTFVNTYVFPDGELVPIEDVIGIAERSGFEVRDLESLRRSYALTLRHWVANLEQRAAAARAAADERTYRIWRLYMAGSVLAFEQAAISVYQMLLAPPQRPWRHGRKRLLAADDT
jgi:cyclopropane-fatty-acyl-phospholipid synthase